MGGQARFGPLPNFHRFFFIEGFPYEYFCTYVLFCTFVLFFVRKWLRAVKIYLHAKFRVSSSKIERVMLNLVFCTPDPPSLEPVTNLPVELCALRQLTIRKY